MSRLVTELKPALARLLQTDREPATLDLFEACLHRWWSARLRQAAALFAGSEEWLLTEVEQQRLELQALLPHFIELEEYEACARIQAQIESLAQLRPDQLQLGGSLGAGPETDRSWSS